MKTINLKTPVGRSEIVIGNEFSTFNEEMSQKTVIITDKNLENHYGKELSNFRTIVLDPGEVSKSISVIELIYKKLMEYDFDKSHQLFGFGGGVVCDIAGFVAATYMRGVNFSFYPTTLLAQVDAAIGGKNGFNVYGFKNIIGTIRQPRKIIIDTRFLKTLPQEELKNGYSEVIKTALIDSRKSFDFVSKNSSLILNHDRETLIELIYRIASIKSRIVQRDFDESKGLRTLLNLGHTFGHGIETVHNLPHGWSVAIGMKTMLDISEKKGLLDSHVKSEIVELMKLFGLDVDYKFNAKKVIQAIGKDKKRRSEFINLVFLQNIGRPKVESFEMDTIEELLK